MSRMTTLTLTPGIAGVDEAGRGPLAGPVVVAAVLIPEGFDATGIHDSKKLTRQQREALADRIRAGTIWSLVSSSPDEIEEHNILQATLRAMEQAIERLSERPKSAIIDGNKIPLYATVPCNAIVKADEEFAAVAAASILAKTERDRLMYASAIEFPGYGFERNVGYGTPEHLEAIRHLGPCPIHRRSFEPIRSLLQQPCLMLGE
jgi:ribonuclease HII